MVTESEIKTTSKELYSKLKDVDFGLGVCSYTKERCEGFAPIVAEINRLKAEKNAVILAHSYLVPEIIYGVADFVGDSYKLSIDAKEAQADLIVFAAVDFMADTAKLLNPSKTVVAPNRNGGCSLAESITGAQVRKLREEFTDYVFVCYINTTAEVKAECDVCVTSSNVYKIIENLENENIYFLPDALMAKNVQNYLSDQNIKKNLKWWQGTCYVHELYGAKQVEQVVDKYPDVRVLAHPECTPEVAQKAHYVGSTSGLLKDIKSTHAERYLLLTECGLAGRVQVENPNKKFVGTCNLCKYMKSNSLFSIRDSLLDPFQFSVEIDSDIAERARSTIDKMFVYAER